jgi:hypothetical protein
MEPASIFYQLTHEEGLPQPALIAASERRAEMLPLFLAEIDRYLAGDAAERSKPTPLLFIFHLLGEWRETSAYRPLARLLRCPDDHLDAALGDATTENAHRVMAAVFDGDPQPLYDIILDPEADQFVRSRMCETLAMLVVLGRLDRDEVARFLRDCWANLQPRDACFVWEGWQEVIAVLGLVELRDVVKEAFERGIVHPSWTAFHYFESDLEHAIQNPTEPWPRNNGEYTLFGNTAEELAHWHCFSDEYKQDRERARREIFERSVSRTAAYAGYLAAMAPVRNLLRDVGRNDPCPCGSGKKFKKCCMEEVRNDQARGEFLARAG